MSTGTGGLCHRANLISVRIGLVKPATLREAQKGLQCGMLERT